MKKKLLVFIYKRTKIVVFETMIVPHSVIIKTNNAYISFNNSFIVVLKNVDIELY